MGGYLGEKQGSEVVKLDLQEWGCGGRVKTTLETVVVVGGR